MALRHCRRCGLLYGGMDPRPAEAFVADVCAECGPGPVVLDARLRPRRAIRVRARLPVAPVAWAADPLDERRKLAPDTMALGRA
jgi:hypothetical protein